MKLCLILIAVLFAATACASSPEAPALLHLQSGSFDPLADSLRSANTGAPAATRYHIVQCAGPVLEDWRSQLDQTGVELLRYIPDFAFLVRAGSDTMGQVRALPFVRWTGPFLPAYKVQPGLLNKPAGTRLSVVLFPGEGAAGVMSAMSGVPERVEPSPDGSHVLCVQGDGRTVEQLAQDESVAWIEEYLEPRLCNNVARTYVGVPKSWQDVGIYGQNQVVAVCDTGLDTGNVSTLHLDFQGKVVSALAYGRAGNWSDPHSHGTHVAGSVLGSGVRSGSSSATHSYASSFAGTAPEARLVMQSILDASGGLGGLGSGLGPILLDALNAGARIHTNSWGEIGSAGRYSIKSRQVDEFCWLHKDMTVFFAAGNEGADDNRDGVVDASSIASPATAKNCVAVGASESVRDTGGYQVTWSGFDFAVDPIGSDRISNNPAGMAAFSSRGPASDGRIKPDLVAPGTNIVSCRSTAAGAGTGWGAYNFYYLYMGGTSMATPLAAGAAALVRQYYVEKKSLANPSAALVKATLINGALDMTPGQYGTGSAREMTARPNSVEGWGRVDVASSLCLTAPRSLAYVDSTSGLSTGTIFNYSYNVANMSVPFRVTLAWTDYPATENASKTLLNDLDLTVIAPDGVTVYRGNGTTDRVNNVEGVDIATPTSGVYTVRVQGYNVPMGPQPYALVVSGGLPATMIQGTVRTATGAGLEGVTVTAGAYSSTTDPLGRYAIRVTPGAYTVIPTRTAWTFNPALRSVTVPAAGITGIDFAGNAGPGLVTGTTVLWKSVSVESPHPYGNNIDRSWTVNGVAGAAYSFVHFDYIDVEEGYDRVYVLDSSDRVIGSWTGFQQNVTSGWVSGSSVKIQLVSDSSNSGDGFKIDWCGGTKAGVPAVSQPGGKQSTTDARGYYSIGGLVPGSYTISPNLPGYASVPAERTVLVGPGEIVSGQDFGCYPASRISGRVNTSTLATTQQLTESPHPYTNNYDYTWTITGPADCESIRVHFASIHTERDYDLVYVLDSAGGEVARYSGDEEDLWSPWVAGRVLRIRFRTDSSIADYPGFVADSFQCETNVTGKGGVLVTASPGGQTATTAADGTYTISGLASGSITVAPSLPSWGFDPPRRSVDLAAGVSETGIDFRAIAPGAVSGSVSYASIGRAMQTTESPHPYPDRYVQSWNVTAPAGAASIRVHFAYIDLESEYDFLTVKGKDGAVLGKYTGRHENVWTEWTAGNQVAISMTSDSSVTYDGFVCDRYEYILPAGSISGVTVTASPGGRTATVASDGTYTIAGLGDGTYEVTASKPGFEFVPQSRSTKVQQGITTSGADFYVWSPAPVNVGLEPAQGYVPTGVKRTITAAYNDQSGYSDLAGCYLLINTTLTKSNGVLLYYDANASRLYLRDDANTAWLGGHAPGASATVENRQCKLYCGQTTVETTASGYAVNWRVELKPKMGGKTCGAWMMVKDDGGLQDGWDLMGTLMLKSLPINLGLTAPTQPILPDTKTTITTSYRDPDGWQDLSECRVLINTTLSGANCAHLMLDVDTGKLYVRNDANTAWLGGIEPGSPGIIENSYCRLYCEETTTQVDGATVTVNWRVEFRPGMSGRALHGWLRVEDDDGTRDDWEDKGTLPVDRPPANVSLLLPNGGAIAAGTKVRINSYYSDPDGNANIAQCRLLVNTVLNGANCPNVMYDSNANKLYVRNDSNTGWVGGYAPLSANVIESASCRLYCGETTISGTGMQRVVSWKVEFRPSMAGKSCGAWLAVTDDFGLQDTWEKLGQVAVE